MPSHTRVSGSGDSAAAGRGRQRLKIGAIGYAASRHGIDATPDLVEASRKYYRQMALEYVSALPGDLLRNRRLDHPGDDTRLCAVGIAYASARHGIDGDVGMAREAMAMLCQAAFDWSETLPLIEESPKRSSGSSLLHLGNGVS